jgi:hypothetical protein
VYRIHYSRHQLASFGGRAREDAAQNRTDEPIPHGEHCLNEHHLADASHLAHDCAQGNGGRKELPANASTPGRARATTRATRQAAMLLEVAPLDFACVRIETGAKEAWSGRIGGFGASSGLTRGILVTSAIRVKSLPSSPTIEKCSQSFDRVAEEPGCSMFPA